MISLRVPLKIESLNHWLGKHWSERHRERKVWARTMGYIGKKAQGPYRNVSITSHRPRFLDPDNLSGGAKIVLDAMKELGWIEDDSQDKVTVEYKQAKSKDQETLISMW